MQVLPARSAQPASEEEAVMGERDSTDDVLLPDELKSMIDQFAIDAAIQQCQPR